MSIMFGLSEADVNISAVVYINILKTQICFDEDFFQTTIDTEICKSDHLACIRRQNQNVLSDVCRDVE